MRRNRFVWYLTARCFLIAAAAVAIHATGGWQALSWAAVVLASAGLMAFFVSMRLSRQLERLRRAAESLANGNNVSKLPTSSIAEFASLAKSLNIIGDELIARSERLGRQGHEQEAVLASMLEGVLAIDSAQRIISVNEAAADLIGASSASADFSRGRQANLYGRNLHEVVRNADLRRLVERALESTAAVEDEIILRGTQERILRARGTALRDVAGRSVGAVLVLDDVTRDRQLENLRRDFVANVSHELKTPIAAIKGFVETLLDGALTNTDDACRFLRIIDRHVDRLNDIIADLLILSKIERSEETADLPLEQTALLDVLKNALEACQAMALQRDIALNLSCSRDFRALINPPLFEQAVMNLIDNAIKYSEPRGTVVVEVRRDAGQLIIAVGDQGCGIAAEHLPRLFERFYRVDRARSRKLGGTGLGLAIVKHIIQAHRGHVSVASIPGQGSVFSIHLPVAPQANTAESSDFTQFQPKSAVQFTVTQN